MTSEPSGHLTPDQLVDVALGDAPGAGHVATCAACTAEVDRLRHAAAALASLRVDPVLLAPPPARVWSAVRDAVADRPAPTVARANGGRRWRAVAAGFAAGVVATAAVVGAVVALRPTDRPTPRPDRPAAVERADLRPLPRSHPAATGTASVVRVGDGWALDVRLDRAAPTGAGFVEAWLLDPATGRMVSLGAVEGRAGRLTIPGGVDLGVYGTVDISLEPYDGNPAHSTDSIARGRLTAIRQ